MAAEYFLDRADTTGARFTIDRAEQLFFAYFWLAPAGLLTFFAGQTLWGGVPAERVYAYVMLAAAAAFVIVTVIASRRPLPPSVLVFDNFSRTLRFEDANGRLLSSTPYADVGPFRPERVSDSGPDGQGRTYYVIRMTLRDGRMLPLGGNASERARDEQVATLRQCVALPPAADASGPVAPVASGSATG